tara:strand:+ start:38 stop:151 length:114 start_codon:yes stop_codon:yes gene_type:complete
MNYLGQGHLNKVKKFPGTGVKARVETPQNYEKNNNTK